MGVGVEVGGNHWSTLHLLGVWIWGPGHLQSSLLPVEHFPCQPPALRFSLEVFLIKKIWSWKAIPSPQLVLGALA